MSHNGTKDFYLDITAVIVECLKDAGLPPNAVIKLATLLSSSLYARFAGSCFYFPKNAVEKAGQRAVAIVAEFNGSNFRELALKYDLSENRVRQIVKRAGIMKDVKKED